MKIIKGSTQQSYVMQDGIQLFQVGAHGQSILDLIDFSKTDLEKTGIGYILPVQQGNSINTLIFFKSFEASGRDEDLNHFEWWSDEISNILATKNRLDEEDAEEIGLSYTGTPRFRVEKVDDKFIIYHGNNFCSKIRARIIGAVRLQKDDYEFVYDHHEEMDKNDARLVQSILGIKYGKLYCH